MSWPFSNEYAITTASVASRIIDDDQLDDYWKTVVLTAAVNKADVGDVFVHELITGIGARAERVHDHAGNPDKYALGLVNHTLVNSSTGAVEIQNHLALQHLAQIDLVYHYLAPLNPLHAAYEYLHNVHGYDSLTQKLGTVSTQTGTPVYVEHIAVSIGTEHAQSITQLDESLQPHWQIHPNTYTQQWENIHAQSPVWSYTLVGNTKATVHISYLSALPVTGTATDIDWSNNGVPVSAQIPNMDSESFKLYGYNFETAYGSTNADINDFVVRTTLEIDLLANGYDITGNYFQTRYSYVDADTQITAYFTHSAEQSTINSISNLLDEDATEPEFFPLIFFISDYVQLAASDLSDTTEYEQTQSLLNHLNIDYKTFGESIYSSEGIATISQSFLMWGIPINSQYTEGLEYLYQFYNWLRLSYSDPTIEYNKDSGTWLVTDLNTTHTISFSDNDSRMSLHYLGMYSQLVQGTLSTECESEMLTQVMTYIFPKKQIFGITSTEIDIDVWVFRKQVNDQYYREIYVARPQSSYSLGGRNSTNTVEHFITDYDSFIVPLHYGIAQQYFTTITRQSLYGQALHLINNSYDRTQLEFYETAGFASILKIVAIVAVIASFGTMTAQVQALYSSILAAVGSQIGAIILTAAVVVGLEVGLSAAFAYVAVKTGGEDSYFASLALIVATVVATVQGMPQANKLVIAANGLGEASAQQLAQETAKTYEQITGLQESYIEQTELIQEALDELNYTANLFERIGLYSVNNPYETADDFYTRIASGLQSPSNTVKGPELFLENSLRLPEVSDTLKFGKT